MNRQEEDSAVLCQMERILPGSRLLGTSVSHTSTQTDQAVPNEAAGKSDQIFPNTPYKHDLPSGGTDPGKDRSPDTTGALLIPEKAL